MSNYYSILDVEGGEISEEDEISVIEDEISEMEDAHRILYVSISGEFHFEIPYQMSDPYFEVMARLADELTFKLGLNYFDFLEGVFLRVSYGYPNYGMDPMFLTGIVDYDNSAQNELYMVFERKQCELITEALLKFPVAVEEQDFNALDFIPDFRRLFLEYITYDEDDIPIEYDVCKVFKYMLTKMNASVGGLVDKLEDIHHLHTVEILYEGTVLMRDDILDELFPYDWEYQNSLELISQMEYQERLYIGYEFDGFRLKLTVILRPKGG